jgi:hypothetical protein
MLGGVVVRMDGRGSPLGEQGAEARLPERFPEAGEACSRGGEEGQDRHVDAATGKCLSFPDVVKIS